LIISSFYALFSITDERERYEKRRNIGLSCLAEDMCGRKRRKKSGEEMCPQSSMISYVDK